ncbi:hypothetical protein [Bradyrhizobium sp. NBAIM14]|uniref:hypothetical protein n=2 Tax=Nitrobacteraceae TaxID=41294 RepID=UPI001CD6718A|nr:hypothetical protein [Bradyrhizobium sp. NBAIM14]MCA1499876.1 hypothetical protein [Bradyrhizobium sp. NBAIM14]
MSDAGGPGTNTADEKDAKRDPGWKPTDAEVLRRENGPVRQVLLPVFLVILGALFIAFVAHWNMFKCAEYTMLILSYALLFGAGGLTLGGALRIRGQLKLLGLPWTVDAAGGIAAALLAGSVAYSLKPACGLDWKVRITELPLLETTNFAEAKAFATIDINSDGVVMQRKNNNTIGLHFEDKDDFKITVRLYRVEKEGYKPLGTCEIDFLHAQQAPDEQAENGNLVFWLQDRSPLALSFNKRYVDTLVEADRNSDAADYKNLCLTGVFSTGSGPADKVNVITPLQLVRSKVAYVGPRTGPLKIFYTKKKSAAPTDSKAATRQVAQAEVRSSNEVLTPTGTGGVSSAPPITTPKTSNTVVSQSTPVAAPGCQPDATIRPLIDAFLNGDDLEKKVRQDQIYPNWPNVNCYVLPIATSINPGTLPQQQSRALKLLINAIINNSLIPGDLTYWQLEGTKKRDFRKSLPYLQDGDILRIFEFVASDEPPVRAEALRFVKLLPVDALERLFKLKLQRMKANAGENRDSPIKTERFAVAAISLYYNRIVESLDGDADASTRSALGADFASGSEWAVDAFLNGRSAKPYEAMLLYAKGIVERELKFTDSGTPSYRATFAKMISRLKLTEESYPLRPLHIAQAMAYTTSLSESALTDMLKQLQQAEQITPALALDESFQIAGKSLPMFSGPRKDLGIGVAASTKDGANILLRLGDWYFVRGNGKIGWISRLS